MIPAGLLSLLVISSLLSQTTKNIERAFFQDDPTLLYDLLPTRDHINVSLPEPISFSDQLSAEQTYFFFRHIYSVFSTFEFYPESELPVFTEKKHFIFRARWSFRNKKNDNQYVFQVFFYLTISHESSGSKISERNEPGAIWKITEIKAEKV